MSATVWPVVQNTQSWTCSLINSTDYERTVGLLAYERDLCLQGVVPIQGSLDRPKLEPHQEAVWQFIAYINRHWMSQTMWHSWSERGRSDAATVMKVPPEKVVRTTNHLESFNGSLKGRYLPQYERSGKRVRPDVFIRRAVHDIIPHIFSNLRAQDTFLEWRSSQFPTVPEKAVTARVLSAATSVSPRLLWFPKDYARQERASGILATGRLLPIPSFKPYEVWATCVTSSAAPSDRTAPRYWLTHHATGAGSCSCADWLTAQGQACKHLRALRTTIEKWVDHDQYPFPGVCPIFVESLDEALEVERKNVEWYGDTITHAVTTVAPSGTGVSEYCSPDVPPTLEHGTKVGKGLPPSPNLSGPALAVEGELQQLGGDEASPHNIVEGEESDTEEQRSFAEDLAEFGLDHGTFSASDGDYVTVEHIYLGTEQRD